MIYRAGPPIDVRRSMLEKVLGKYPSPPFQHTNTVAFDGDHQVVITGVKVRDPRVTSKVAVLVSRPPGYTPTDVRVMCRALVDREVAVMGEYHVELELTDDDRLELAAIYLEGDGL